MKNRINNQKSWRERIDEKRDGDKKRMWREFRRDGFLLLLAKVFLILIYTAMLFIPPFRGIVILISWAVIVHLLSKFIDKILDDKWEYVAFENDTELLRKRHQADSPKKD